MTNRVFDIWFYTALPLADLGEQLGLQHIRYDMENVWEWIVGDFGTVHLDITRQHLVAPEETETRIFRVPRKGFSPWTVDDITQKLQDVRIDPIYLGEWLYLHGNEYEMKVRRII